MRVSKAGVTPVRITLSCLFLFLAFFNIASGKGTLSWEIIDDRAEVDYPEKIRFSAKFANAAQIEQVTLIYHTNAQSCRKSLARQEVDFEGGEPFLAEWTWDLNKSGALPPGTQVTWNWEVLEKGGSLRETQENSLVVEDPHFIWETTRSERYDLYWTKGGASFGKAMSKIVDASLDRLYEELGVVPQGRLRVMIYPSSEEVKDATLHTPDWIGGVAYPEYGTILMGIPPDSDKWAEAVIPHELTHLVVDQRIGNCVGYRLPTWLNEGLAMYMEGEASKAEIDGIKEAVENDRLYPLLGLTAGFQAQSDQAGMAYSQSRQVASFLLETYGREKLDELLDLVKAGTPFENALQATYGYDTETLDQAWRADLGYGTMPTPSWDTPEPKKKRTSVPTIALWTAVVQATETPETLKTVMEPTGTPTVDPSTEAAQATAIQTGLPDAHTERRATPWWGIGMGLAAVTGGMAFFIILRRKKKYGEGI